MSDTAPNQHFARFNALVDSGHAGRLTHAQLRVWIVLERHADVEGGKTFPSHGTIANKVGMSIRSVQRAIDELISTGLLEKLHRSSPGKVPEYRLAMPSQTDDTHDVACTHDTHDTQSVACNTPTGDTHDVVCSAAGSESHDTRMSPVENEHTTENGVTHDKNQGNTRHPHVASTGLTGITGYRESLYGEALPTPRKTIPPDRSAVATYAEQIGLASAEVDRFMDHYKSNGWRVGKNPMKDWEAALRNWKRGRKQPAAAIKAAREFPESAPLPVLGGGH